MILIAQSIRGLRHRWVLARWLAAFLLLVGSRAFGAAEYEVKAAHLPKFAGYIEWPAAARPGSTLIVGIVGRDPSGGTIEQTLSGATVEGRHIEVRRVTGSDVAGLRACQIIFVSASEEGRTDEILRSVQGRPVLTVGETENFAASGGMLQFILVDGQVRFVANPGAAARSGLQMNSNLLRVARRVLGR